MFGFHVLRHLLLCLLSGIFVRFFRLCRLALHEISIAHDFRDLLAAPLRDASGRGGTFQAVERRFHHIVRVRRSDRLGDDIRDA